MGIVGIGQGYSCTPKIGYEIIFCTLPNPNTIIKKLTLWMNMCFAWTGMAFSKNYVINGASKNVKKNKQSVYMSEI